jgi:arylsulfatase A-like enzyme
MTAPILFVVVDCLRADRAFAQAELAPDGFLGRLMRRGRVYTNAITVTPTTTPAVATMLTGLYPFEHGLRGLLGYTRPPDLPTVASALGTAGYRTEADVTGPLLPELKLFDEFDDYRYVHEDRATLHGERGSAFAERVNDLRTSGRPWFFLFHVWDLHEPRRVPPGFRGPAPGRTVYDRALGALDARLAELFPEEALSGLTICLIGDHGENLRFEPRGKIGKGLANLLWWKPTRWAMQPVARRIIAYGARSHSKRVLRLAPRHVITHGHHLFEPLLRVPYVLAGEGVTPGRSDALVTHTDLAPTFAELAETWFAGGRGALRLPLDGDVDPERRVALETAWVTSLRGIPQVGLRTPRWKYMQLADGGAPALFDLTEDPRECRNVVRRFPGVAAELRDELEAMMADARTAEPMAAEDATLVAGRLRDLGYLE